jgi:hypothetical protein
MKMVISVHILPTELGKYGRLIEDLNLAYENTNPNKHTISFYSALNLNNFMINWNKSKISKNEIISTYHEINKNLKITNKECICETNKNFYGVVDHRKATILKYTNVDSIIYLDPDLYFSDSILQNHIVAYELIRNKSEHFIVTPQRTKLWDDTWDCIVNKKYLKENHQFYKKINPRDIVNLRHGKISVEKTNSFKWGGGWFNSISQNLLSYVNIPNAFTGYGFEDTYLMACAFLLRRHGHDVQQYILKNELVAEDPRKAKNDKFSDIPIINIKEKLHSNAKYNFQHEVQKFRAKL